MSFTDTVPGFKLYSYMKLLWGKQISYLQVFPAPHGEWISDCLTGCLRGSCYWRTTDWSGWPTRGPPPKRPLSSARHKQASVRQRGENTTQQTEGYEDKKVALTCRAFSFHLAQNVPEDWRQWHWVCCCLALCWFNATGQSVHRAFLFSLQTGSLSVPISKQV